MKIVTRKVKVFFGVLDAVLMTGVGVTLVDVTFFDKQDVRYKDQAALLAAMPYTATGELTARGLRLAAPLECWSMPEATPQKLRVACSGRTTEAKPILVIAAGEQRVRRQYFTILVDGRPVVQNTSCLGADCHG